MEPEFCYRCGYERGELGTNVCPECGTSHAWTTGIEPGFDDPSAVCFALAVMALASTCFVPPLGLGASILSLRLGFKGLRTPQVIRSQRESRFWCRFGMVISLIALVLSSVGTAWLLWSALE